MAGILGRLGFPSGSPYLWCSPSVAPVRGYATSVTATKSAAVNSASIQLVDIHPADYTFKGSTSVTRQSAAVRTVLRDVSAITTACSRPRGRVTLPRGSSRLSRPFRVSFGSSPFPLLMSDRSRLSSGPTASFCPSSVLSSSLPSDSSSTGATHSRVFCTEEAGWILRLQRRVYQEQRKSQKRQEFQEQLHQLQHHQQGGQQQDQEDGQSHEDRHQHCRGIRALAVLAMSPLLFTQWEETSAPKNELIFLAGNTLGYCTEKFFENEYGQSVFACVLGLVYLALLGYEGKVNGAVWRMKHVFGTNMKVVGHPRYAYALQQNPLLSSSQNYASK